MITSDAMLTRLLADTPHDAVALHYTGFFSQSGVVAMAEVIRLYLEQHEASLPVRRRLFSTFVEMVQNIMRYSSDSRALCRDADEMRFGAICVGTHAGRYICESANLILSADAHRLTQCLEDILALDAAGIKAAYKQSLQSESPAWSKGAHVGLLTLARDASQPLEFTFRQVGSTDLSAFWLKATL